MLSGSNITSELRNRISGERPLLAAALQPFGNPALAILRITVVCSGLFS